MSNNFETTIIFKEAMIPEANYVSDAAVYAEDDSIGYSEEDIHEILPAELVTHFEEVSSEVGTDDLASVTVKDVFEPFIEGDESLGELGEDLEDLDEDVTKFVEEHGDTTLEDLLLPGSNVSSKELDNESNSDTEETDYVNDGDLSKFIEYVNDQYPGNIPQHDGRTTVGCERAVSFLDRMNGEISRAIRDDHDNVLDLASLENIRVNIMRDILLLKNHLGKLKKKLKDDQANKVEASMAPFWTSPSGVKVNPEDLKKEASTPRNIVIAVSPFERAISGIMINAHVSGGHPMEDVYDFLSNKYSINDREELAIMQLCMDSGFHIFKDRGTFSSNSSKDTAGQSDGSKAGVDFMRNYFA